MKLYLCKNWNNSKSCRVYDKIFTSKLLGFNCRIPK